MDRIAPVSDVRKINGIGIVQSQGISCNGGREWHTRAGLEDSSELPSTCGPAQPSRQVAGAWDLP